MIRFSERHRLWAICLVLVLVTLALYWPARQFDFVQYDDDEYVFNNQTVRSGLTWYGLAWAFVDSHAANWHPLTWISHMVDCQLFGLNPRPPHLENVLLHCGNTVLLFLLLRTMTGTLWRSAFVAALFAWHPLRVESVAWVSERKDVLSGFFFFLTLLTYVKYARCKVQSPNSELQDIAKEVEPPPPSSIIHNPSSGIRHSPSISHHAWTFWRWFSLACFSLGLLAKPMLVTVPFVLLLMDFWPLRRFDRSPGEASATSTPNAQSPATNFLPLLVEKIPFFLLSAAVAVVTFFAQRSGGAIVSLKAENAATRVANMFAGYLGYLEKVFWPHDLSFLYLRPDSVPILTIVLGALVLLGGTGLALLIIRSRWPLATRHSPFAIGWLWFLGMMLPVSGLAQTGLHAITDRYTYLPSIGLAVMVVWGLSELAPALAPRQTGMASLVAGGLTVLCACLGLTRHQLGFWRNTETLMEHALQIDPNNYIAHQDLAVYYTKLGQTEAARQHRLKFQHLDPALRNSFGVSQVGKEGAR